MELLSTLLEICNCLSEICWKFLAIVSVGKLHFFGLFCTFLTHSQLALLLFFGHFSEFLSVAGVFKISVRLMLSRSMSVCWVLLMCKMVLSWTT